MKNVNISNESATKYSNNTINFDADSQQQKAICDNAKYLAVRPQQEKFDRLRNLYSRSGAKSSQGKQQRSQNSSEKKGSSHSFYHKNAHFIYKLTSSKTNNYVQGQINAVFNDREYLSQLSKKVVHAKPPEASKKSSNNMCYPHKNGEQPHSSAYFQMLIQKRQQQQEQLMQVQQSHQL